ncbi:hypothetical protein FXF51_06175 [Nonomuraea sp. PA05]|uniref:hypothetical protein n=1 Tax=Nonomuraea sp. PA05 TaxID=2604466 RepID=UPI0011D90B50|nr:hypothetical protein [Nonomuraea sp. PA05]TYB69747.1 hypothetical protein FXF51_06175 [Nonomuraea sp. PA05]
MPEQPDEGLSYAEQLRRKGIQVRTTGWTWATRDQVAEWTGADGGRFKRTTDQAGHETTQETTPDGHEKQHVRVNLR